jgi:zinc protease
MSKAFTRLAVSTALIWNSSAFAPSHASAPAAEPNAASMSKLVKKVAIPFKQFTLKNGLRVLVHTDRKAPIVAVSVWYDVGSKHEPKGKTGFAHLFEHLMFEGSENVPNFDETTIRLGGANNNGSTWFDRTNYFENVPTGALDRMLYIEADRMGYLLGAVSQDRLDAQRGVVQNEKRQGDNDPYGLVEYAQIKAMVPAEHPYGHSTIGSMADLDAASLEDVRAWFRQHYGPNNAVLVLAGDIDVATARKLVEKNFGSIKATAKQPKLTVAVPTLAAPKSEVMKDDVATVRLYRNWMVPGMDSDASVPLNVAASVLGGLSSSRLDNALVRDEQVAVRVTAGYQEFAQIGGFEVTVDVKPGVDPDKVAARLDAIIADYVKNGPNADEVKRVQMWQISGQIAGLESVGGSGGKAVTLAEGALYMNDGAFFKKQLTEMANVTPAKVTKAMQKWLTRPAYSLRVEPGERATYEESKPVIAATEKAEPIARTARSAMPDIGPVDDLQFPATQRTKLQNGIEVVYVQRNAVATTNIALNIDAGHVADPRDRLGTQALMLALLSEGANGLTSLQIAEQQERLGANISASASMDTTSVRLFTLSDNLAPSLGLFSDIVMKPTFAPDEVERLRGQQLASIQNELKDPQSIAYRFLPPILYGSSHGYGISFTGTGDAKVVQTIGRADLISFHQKWFRPEKSKLFVVSDRPLAEIKAALDLRFGNWSATGPAGQKKVLGPIPQSKPRIILFNRPDSPQSVILGGQVLPAKGSDDLDFAIAANQVVGQGFLSRINNDLRQTKSWSYGVRGSISRVKNDVPYLISAPVQADKTGASIAALLGHYHDFLGQKGTSAEEYDRVIGGNIRELPGRFETSGQLLGAIESNSLFNRPDSYYGTLASKYKRMTASEMDKAIRQILKPDQFTWVVVGDAAKVTPQLESLGLPIEISKQDANPADTKVN